MNPNQTQFHPSCESYEMDISAMLDGELDGPSKAALGQHLIQCEACRQVVRDFEAINQFAYVEPDYFANTTNSNTSPRSPRRKSLLFFVAAAAATVLAASVVLVLWLNSNTPPQPVASIELVKPISELQEISYRRQRNQELQLKAMELELRQLRLELAGLEDENAQSDMQSKLDVILNRVFEEQFYSALD